MPPPVWNASSVPTGWGNSTASSSLSASTWIGWPPRSTHDGRGVVVERALERVDDLVVERRLGLLRQPADVDLDLLRLVEPPDALGREDVHHARREPAVGNHRHPWPRPPVRGASSARTRSRCCRRGRRSGTRPRRRPGPWGRCSSRGWRSSPRCDPGAFSAPRPGRSRRAAPSRSRPPQSPAQERWKVVRPQIGQRHLRNSRILQKIVRARTTL